MQRVSANTLLQCSFPGVWNSSCWVYHIDTVHFQNKEPQAWQRITARGFTKTHHKNTYRDTPVNIVVRYIKLFSQSKFSQFFLSHKWFEFYISYYTCIPYNCQSVVYLVKLCSLFLKYFVIFIPNQSKFMEILNNEVVPAKL